MTMKEAVEKYGAKEIKERLQEVKEEQELLPPIYMQDIMGKWS